MTIETTTLDSGITVVTERMPDVRSVSTGFWVGTGSRDESSELAGASHFLEHLLFKGTPTRQAREIAELVDAVGGDMNAFTTKEYTAFYMRVLDQSLPLALDILCEILVDPAFRPSEVEAERQVILEEILMRADEPSDLVHEVMAAAMFPDHPLGREVLGEEDTIEAMSREGIEAFWSHHYRGGNIVFAAAGRLEHDEIVAGVAARFGGREGGAPPVRQRPTMPAVPLAVDHRPTEQAHVLLGVPALNTHDPDRYACAVLDHVLGGGLSSRLFQTIREERGLAYSVYSSRSAYADAGAMTFYAGTAPSHAHEVLDLMQAELDSVRTAGITVRELEIAQGHLIGEMALSLEDSGARMGRIGRGQMVHGHVLAVDEVVAHIDAVTLDQVAAVADRVLSGPQVLAVVGPFDEDAFEAPQVA